MAQSCFSQRYRLRLPFHPDEVIGCCGKSFIGNNLSFATVDQTFVCHPAFAIPHLHVRGHVLNGHLALVRQHHLSFCDTGQFGNLAFLAQVTIDTVLFYRHTEHLTGRLAIDIAALPEQFHAPFFARKPCKHPGLNRAEVGHEECAALPGYKGSADQLGQHIQGGIVEQAHSIVVTGADERPCLFQIGHLVLGQILQLNQSARVTCDPNPAVSSDEKVACGGDCTVYFAIEHFNARLHTYFVPIFRGQPNIQHICILPFRVFWMMPRLHDADPAAHVRQRLNNVSILFVGRCILNAVCRRIISIPIR